MRRILVGILLVLALLAFPVKQALAAPTADVTIEATPEYISIEVSWTEKPDPYSFGVVSANSTPSTATDYFSVTNASTVNIVVSIAVLQAPWTSDGTGWTHSNTGEAGNNTVGLLSNKGGSWGVSDVIVKSATPLNIADNQTGNFDFGLKLLVPTEFTDEKANSNTVRLSATKYGA